MPNQDDSSDIKILRISDISVRDIDSLLDRFELSFETVADHAQIPGSFWGEPEAGVVGHCVYFRPDTPVHSLLHEASHVVCMTPARRAELTGNAGGDDLEESAVCYLQLVLADWLPGVGRSRLMRDMDSWGYSFRFGNTQSWFEEDASDARVWLHDNGLLEGDNRPTWSLRQ